MGVVPDDQEILRNISQVLQARAEAFFDGELDVVELRAAATVVMVGDTDHGISVYLQRRSRTMAFAPGMYVFPGGAVEEQDVLEAGAIDFGPRGQDSLPARLAAIRETREESGYEIHDPQSLTYIAHWATPEIEPKRFDTRFYGIVVDDPTAVHETSSESEGETWTSPSQAIAKARSGEIVMMPPTIAVLSSLADLDQRGVLAQEAIEEMAKAPIVPILPVPRLEPGSSSSKSDFIWDLVDLREWEENS